MIKRLVTAVVLIPIVLVLVLRAPAWGVAAVSAAVALITVAEFLKLVESYAVRPLHGATYAFVALFFLLLLVSGGGKPLLATAQFVAGAVFAAAIAPFFFLTIAMRRAEMASGYPAAAASTVAFVYVALPLGLLAQLRQQYAGAFLLLYLLLVVWAGDIFAYFVGRLLGRHRMAPRISPGKTWEGAVASLLASLVVGGALFWYASPLCTALLGWGLIQRRDGMFALERPALAPILVLSTLLNVAAQLGDLAESLIKRGAGVKDSGTILPGHGGMLDRIDALLFATPVLWVWAAWRMLG